MTARLSTAPDPDVMSAIRLLHQAIHATGVDPMTLELVHLRVSQVNECSPCVYAGVASARRRGESDERLHGVAAWRETSLFSEGERAALTLAEAASRIADGAPGVTDPVWATAGAHFDDRQLGGLVLEIALTNFFNTINRATLAPAGTTW